MKKRIQGIYCILNLKNNKIYVGSSVDIKTRFRVHLTGLRSDKHLCSKLMTDFKEYGEAYFIVKILQQVENKEDLFKYEKEWIINLETQNPEKGYNITTPSITGGTDSHNEETKEKLRKIVYNHNYSKRSDEEYEEWKLKVKIEKERIKLPIETFYKAIVVLDENNNLLFESDTIGEVQRKLNLDREKIREVLVGKRNVGKGIWKTAHSYKGYVFVYKDQYTSEKDYTVKRREVNRGRIDRIIEQYDLQNNLINTFISSMEIERTLGIKNGNISGCCTGKSKTAGGYIWKYKELT
jgi:group I intron endonuclease